MKVWIVQGWFGSDEWIESVHATQESAERAVALLWETRDSEQTPQMAKGVAKFGADPWTVQP